MSNAHLHPIVTNPIISWPFTCRGDGLLHEGVKREDPDELRDLLVPIKTSSLRPIEDNERPRNWWKAQCVHYDLDVSDWETIKAYRRALENEILRHRKLKLPQRLADLESELNTEFIKRNARERRKRRQAELRATEPQSETGTRNFAPKAKLELSKYGPVGSHPAKTKTTTSKKRKAEDIVHARSRNEGKYQPDIAQEQETTRSNKQPRTTATSAKNRPSSRSARHSRSNVHPTPSQAVVRGGVQDAYVEVYRLKFT